MAKAKQNGAGLGAVRYVATKRTKRPGKGPNRPRRKAYRGQGKP